MSCPVLCCGVTPPDFFGRATSGRLPGSLVRYRGVAASDRGAVPERKAGSGRNFSAVEIPRPVFGQRVMIVPTLGPPNTES